MTVNGLVGEYIPQNNVEIVFTTLLMILNMTIVRWIIGEVCPPLRVQGSGFRVQGTECRVQGSGFRPHPSSPVPVAPHLSRASLGAPRS